MSFQTARHLASPRGPALPEHPVDGPDRGLAGAGAWSRRRLGAASLLGLAAWLTGCGQATPASPPEGSFFSNFKGLQLQDQDGQALRWQQWQGHLVLVNFVYTGCSTVCPMQTAALVDMGQRLPADLRGRVKLLSVSLDPLHDSPAVLKAFAQRLGADQPAWRFATGRPEDIERLSGALALFRPGPDVRKPDDHSTALWLVDPAGMLRFRYSGNPPDVDRLVRELGQLDRLGTAPPA